LTSGKGGIAISTENQTIISENTGYLHPQYAYSLCEFGKPLELPQCGGGILERPINGTPYKDAMGCYPLFTCQDWSCLHKDLEQISPTLLSLSLVTDPFSGATPDYLNQCFDIVKPFKKHYVANLSYPLESFIAKTHCSHYYYAQKSLEQIDVCICNEPIQYFNEWVKLYDNLIRRHNIKGVIAFSHQSFETQLKLPGAVMAVGLHKGEVVGAGLIFIQGHFAYYHLAAYSNMGYKTRASYGIFWKILEYLQSQGILFVDIGGCSGIKENPENGLWRFKKGWTNETHLVYLCGRIFDRQKYEAVCQSLNITGDEYFPAYRRGEFT
jgi:hypothetical protein